MTERGVIGWGSGGIWLVLGYLWMVVPEGREYIPGPQSGEVAATAHGAIENAWLMLTIWLGLWSYETWRGR